MKHIAYLASRVTLPGSLFRRTDAFEHDDMMDALRPAFAAAGMHITDISWDDPAADWRAFDAAIIGTTWDYSDRLDEFLGVLARIESQTQLFNPVRLVRWNARKTYLRELSEKGARLIPTLWMDAPCAAAIGAAFDRLGTDDIVVKRQVGAGARGQHRLRRGDPIPELVHAMMVQPFIPAIASEGEFSFIFIDGEASHALVKRPLPGDYRIQSSYGGREERIMPSAADMEQARGIIAALGEAPLYARVDMVRAADGQLMLMELEVIEPYLYPGQGPDLGDRMAAALARRLA